MVLHWEYQLYLLELKALPKGQTRAVFYLFISLGSYCVANAKFCIKLWHFQMLQLSIKSTGCLAAPPSPHQGILFLIFVVSFQSRELYLKWDLSWLMFPAMTFVILPVFYEAYMCEVCGNFSKKLSSIGLLYSLVSRSSVCLTQKHYRTTGFILRLDYAQVLSCL